MMVFLKKRFIFIKINSNLPLLRKANDEFESFLNTINPTYFNDQKSNIWKEKHQKLFNEVFRSNLFKEITSFLLAQIVYKWVFLFFFRKYAFARKQFLKYYNESEKYRVDFNRSFIELELKSYSHFFDYIEGRKLDFQQRKAIVADEDNNLIIASAGSGKTLTIVGKIKYLLQKYNILPEEILLISFTRKSANDLKNRAGIPAYTFHKLGMNIITNIEGVQPTIFNQNQTQPILKSAFNQNIKEESYLKIFNNYFLNYIRPYKSQFEFKTQGEYIQYLKDYNWMPYNNSLNTHFKREIIKSAEVCLIANFLLINNIEYLYKEKYPFDITIKNDSRYTPDFTIFQWQDLSGNTLSNKQLKYYKEQLNTALKEFQHNLASDIKSTNLLIQFKNFIQSKHNIKPLRMVEKKDNKGGFMIDFQKFVVEPNYKKIKLYIDHFDVNRKGEIPKWFARYNESYKDALKRYKNSISYQRKAHKKYKTTLIETYSYEFSEAIAYKQLERKLKEVGIIFNSKSLQEVFEIIMTNAKDDFNHLIDLFRTFLNLMKGKKETIEHLKSLVKQSESFNDKRNLAFLNLFEPIYHFYEKNLKDKNQIDLNDLINKSVDYLERKNLYKYFYRYIIVDEFQDISYGRHLLIKAFQKQNPSCKIFAVGDDWQSIYRFAGSDIGLFVEFEKYFGVTQKSRIETTYRYSNPLLNMSSQFIMKNPAQEQKSPESFFADRKTDFTFYYLESRDKLQQTITLIFDELVQTYPNIKEKSVAVLGRYGFDIDKLLRPCPIINKEQRTCKKECEDICADYHDQIIRSNNDNQFIYKNTITKAKLKPPLKVNQTIKSNFISKEKRLTDINFDFITAHGSKGLEFDIVIIINTDSGKYGFPSQIADDSVLNILLSQSEQYEHSEERRLFYVAMTRAKEKVVFLVDHSNKSQFIHEIEINQAKTHTQNKKCPECLNQDVRLIKQWQSGKKQYASYGCKNYLYGCNYYNKEIIEDGILKKDGSQYYFQVGKYKNQNIKKIPKKYIKWFLEQEELTESTKNVFKKML